MSARSVGPRRVLFCAPMPPEFDKESGSRRIYHLLELARSAGWSTAFVCENAPAASPHVRHLRQLGVPTYVGFGGHTVDLIESGAFDVAIFAFWYLADRYADLVRRLSPTTRIVVETVDVHWLRNARRLFGGHGGSPGLLDERFASEFVGEQNTYAQADGVLTVSEKEAQLINDVVADAHLAHTVPDFDEIDPGEVPFSRRKGIVFVGNFRHPPNVDAVEYLCGEILPLIPPTLRRAHPLRVVGNAPSERVRSLAASCEGVEIVGWVPSVAPYLRAARVSVVPLRYGAGTKRKLIQALLAGTPSVSSPAGIEGMDLMDEVHVLVADDPPGFSTAVERLLCDDRLWTRVSSQGRERIAAQRSRDLARTRLEQAMEVILDRQAKGPTATSIARSSPTGQAEAIRKAVESTVPAGAGVLVVSRGDPDLVRISDGRRASHFPQAPDGAYAGHHPRDSRTAVAHLNELRKEADYLVFPSASYWWLDHYAGLARHLDDRCERVWSDDDCMIYRLAPATNGSAPTGDAPASRIAR